MLELSAIKFKFSKFGFTSISPKIKNKRVFFEKISFKKNKDLLIKDKKDAGALKVKKEDLQKNYNFYADLLLRSGYIKIAEELVKDKIYPYVVMHMLNDKNTKELIWHRDQYFHGKDFIGPKFKLYKLAIYLQDTDKNNGVTGFIPKFISPRFKNRYIDTIFAYLSSFLSIHPRLSIGDAVIFSGKVMHHRPRQRNNNLREAIIFSCTNNPNNLPNLKDDEKEFLNVFLKSKINLGIK
ncbi:hypothetical protein CU311_06090 [Prochlorococcus marinus str. MU1402]|nr:hypothetical protein [Prochlorococcus marinus str. MU1402]